MGKRTFLLILTLLPSAMVLGQDTIIPSVVIKTKADWAGQEKQVLTHQQLVASGSPSLAAALRHMSGVQLQDITGNGSQVMLSLRGFGANASSNTLFLFNGIPLVNPDIAPPNLNIIPIEEIESIEIIAGSESVLYGDQAVGGIVNIISRRQTSEKGEASCNIGSFNARDCLIAYYGHHDRLTYHLSAFSNRSDNYREHNFYDQQQLTGAFSYLYPRGQWQADYYLGQENMQYPGALTAQEVRENRRQANNDINYFKDSNGFFHLQNQQSFSPHWLLETHYAHKMMHGEGVLFLPFTQSRTTDFVKPLLKGRYANTHGEVGLDFQHDTYRLNSLLGLTADRQEKYGVYTLVTFALTPKLDVSLGARGAGQSVNLQSESALNTLNRAFATTLGVTYALHPRLQIYARRAGSFRFPKADEDASTSPGNGPLKTQRGVSYEGGLQSQFPSTTISASLYQLQLRDEIAFDPLQTPLDPFGTNRNLPPTLRYGFSISTQHHVLKDQLILNEQYNYVNARFQSGVNAGDRIPLVAEQLWRTGLNYHFAQHYNLYAEAVYTGNQYAANDDANIAGIMGGYTVYNFHLSYQFKHLTASLRLNNITNKAYYFYTVYQSTLNSEFFYPAPGRNFLFTLKYLFE